MRRIYFRLKKTICIGHGSANTLIQILLKSSTLSAVQKKLFSLNLTNVTSMSFQRNSSYSNLWPVLIIELTSDKGRSFSRKISIFNVVSKRSISDGLWNKWTAHNVNLLTHSRWILEKTYYDGYGPYKWLDFRYSQLILGGFRREDASETLDQNLTGHKILKILSMGQ